MNEQFFTDQLTQFAAVAFVLLFGVGMIRAAKYDREMLKKDANAMTNRFNSDIAAILESFDHSPNREELIRRELEIDSFEWYWNDIAGSKIVNDVVQNKLYPAFYDKLKYFNLKDRVSKIVPEG